MATTTVKAYRSNRRFKTLNIQRRAVGKDDVKLILYCGVCIIVSIHTETEWHGSTYPVVPGHEMSRVVEVGERLVLIKQVI
jgi:uncharacterized zinc-type alcohol dehydrogenase-like protein